MNQPLISVIIPMWNEEAGILRALTSVVNQTYRNLDIIVVDDGSTDRSVEIAEAVAREDSRVRVVRSPKSTEAQRKNWRGYNINAGATARNYGFSLARGEWITLQDADDYSLLNRIEVQYEFAVRRNATMVCVAWQNTEPEALGKKLDVERLYRDVGGEDMLVIRPEALNRLPDENLGILMRLPFQLHRFIPFPFKWFPYTRRLFFGKQTPFPGAGNCILFHRRVIDAGIGFRTRNEREWGVPSGRGADRDFMMHVTRRFQNSWILRVPLYQWDVKTPNSDVVPVRNYLV